MNCEAGGRGLDRYLDRLAQLPQDCGLRDVLAELSGFLPDGGVLALVGFSEEMGSVAVETNDATQRDPPPLSDFLRRIIAVGETVHVRPRSDRLYASPPLARYLAGDELFAVPLLVRQEVMAALCYSSGKVCPRTREAIRDASAAIGLRLTLETRLPTETGAPRERLSRVDGPVSDCYPGEAREGEVLPLMLPGRAERPLADLGSFSAPPWRVVGSAVEVDLAQPLSALLVAQESAPRTTAADADLLTLLSATLGPSAMRVLMGARPRQALAVLPRHNTSAARRLGEKLRERAHSRGIEVKSFVSQAGAASDLYRMIDEVERLARLEAILHLDNGVADAHDFGVYALLLEIGSAERLSAWALRLIGPLISYDAEHRSDLIGTLEAYLTAWGHLAHCASLLRVHPNTLKYRLRRIHEILSLDPRGFSARVELLIACYAYRAAQVLDPGTGSDRDVRTFQPQRLTAGRNDQACEAT